MKLYAPDYYKQFKCIAHECTHSCCVGWEIEVDEHSLNYYRSITGDFGKKLNENIMCEDNSSVFRLGKNERCPFLNKNNLCDIIINLGEDKLCQICTDHPRFRNFYTARTEIGLGLTCEAAAEIILSKETKTSLIQLNETGLTSDLTESELYFFEIRNKLFEIVQDRSKSFKERFLELCSAAEISLPQLTAVQWAKELLTLEQLSDEWTSFLKSISDNETTNLKPSDTQLEQLIVYFIFRHTTPDTISNGLRFALVATDIITKLSPYSDSFIDLCRMFSSEIEYSEENTDYIMFFD